MYEVINRPRTFCTGTPITPYIYLVRTNYVTNHPDDVHSEHHQLHVFRAGLGALFGDMCVIFEHTRADIQDHTDLECHHVSIDIDRSTFGSSIYCSSLVIWCC
jgi:hypothetical protein